MLFLTVCKTPVVPAETENRLVWRWRLCVVWFWVSYSGSLNVRNPQLYRVGVF